MYRTPEETGCKPTQSEKTFRIPSQEVRTNWCYESSDGTAGWAHAALAVGIDSGCTQNQGTPTISPVTRGPPASPTSYLSTPDSNPQHSYLSDCICIAAGEARKPKVCHFQILWQKEGSSFHQYFIKCGIPQIQKGVLDAEQPK